MSAAGWLRQTDPRLAPQSGGRTVGQFLDWRCFGCPFAVLGNLYIIFTSRQDVDVPVIVHIRGSGHMPVVLATGAVLGQGSCLPFFLRQLRRGHAQCKLCRRRGFHSAVLGEAVDTPVVFQRQVPGLFQPVLKTVEVLQLQYFQGGRCPCCCSSSKRCGRPCDYAATQSRSGRCHRFSSSPQFAQRQVAVGWDAVPF